MMKRQINRASQMEYVAMEKAAFFVDLISHSPKQIYNNAKRKHTNNMMIETLNGI